MSQQKAFTLVEMLVAIAIIGILATFVSFQLINNINEGKDVKRKADIELLANAVTSYSSDHYSSKPITDADGCTINSDCGSTIDDALKPYLPTLPDDPSGTHYVYQSDGNTCTISASLSDGTVYQYSCSNEQTSTGTPTNGVCGSSNNQGFYTQPTTNFCSDGSTPTVSGSGPWTWKCPGTYLGSDANCTANKSVDGVCNSSTAGHNYATAPSSNLCTTGSASSVSSGSNPTNYWSWTCAGVYGGTTPTCNANLMVNGACGTASTDTPNNDFYTAPSANLCATGSNTTVAGSGSSPYTGYWKWGCNGYNGGTSTSSTACVADWKVDGVCTTGISTLSKPSSGACTKGTATSPVTGTGPWYWGCNGLNNGTNTASTACVASVKACTSVGGSLGTCGSSTCCIFSGSSCPGGGWSWTGYNITSAASCGGTCFTTGQGYQTWSCTTGYHSSIGSGQETCSYQVPYYILYGGDAQDCQPATCSATITSVGCQ